MIDYIKNRLTAWWKREHCFAKNPLFWLLTAGACAAAPFTGFLSLAAIPVLAGLAENGYLPHDKISRGFRWLFRESSVYKGQVVPQEGRRDETSADSGSSASYQAIAENMQNYSEQAENNGENTLVLYQGTAHFTDEDGIQVILSDLSALSSVFGTSSEEQYIQLADEAVLSLEWLYNYRVKLHLDESQIKEIRSILRTIPEEQRPSRYAEAEKARFIVWSKPEKPGIFFDDTRFDKIMATSGKKIGSRLLLRFHHDKTQLPKEDCRLTTSRQSLPFTLQSVCQTIHRILSHVFIQSKKEREDFWAKCDRIERYFRGVIAESNEGINKLQEERKKSRKNIEQSKKSIAQISEDHIRFQQEKSRHVEKEKQWKVTNLDAAEKVIAQDNQNFDGLRSRLNESVGGGFYLIEVEHIRDLIDENRLDAETINNITVAIIKQDDSQLTLSRRCLQSPENPQGFITKETVILLGEQQKLPSTVLCQLGFVPRGKNNSSSFFSSLMPSYFAKSSSGSSYSSVGTSSDEEKQDQVGEEDKKKALPIAQESLTL